MKQLLIDYISPLDSRLSIVEGKSPNGRMRVKGKIQEAECKNGNGRIYPREILEREINKYINESVQQRISTGELDHPQSEVVNLGNVSHLITKIWWDGNSVLGELELLNTPAGKIAQELILANIPLGISSRGMGSIKQIGETVEVQDDFAILTFDLVSVPSTPNAFMKLSEGKQYNINENNNNNPYYKVNQLITDIMCSISGICPLC